jgi:hypothetical protein
MSCSIYPFAAALVATVTVPTVLAAQAPPGTDIYLVAMSYNGAALSFGAVTNVTDRAGYDNQPSFLPDSGAILYTWNPDGSVLTGSGSKLYRWRYIGGSDWDEVADFEPEGIEGISRLAVSAQGDWIATVGARQ